MNIAEAREATNRPGKFEACSPMAAYIYENELFDDSDGECQAPTGWFALSGRWIIQEDERGAVYGERYSTHAQASLAYHSLCDDYDNWLNTEGED